MSIYFDFKTINELTGDNYYRQPKEFTLDELAQYNGNNGNPAYVAIEGIVYDVTRQVNFGGGTNFELVPGQDITDQFNSYYGTMDILTNAPKVGVLTDDYMNYRYDSYMNRQTGQGKQDTSKFTPDDWVRYITPIVTFGLREPSQGSSPQRIYQKVAILGVLVGLGKTPQEAISQLQDWQSTGASKLLKGGTTTGTSTGAGSGTSGGMGTGGSGTGTGIGGGFGTGGSGTGTGTSGGFGTGGSGAGTGTSGGMGTGGSGAGTGTSGGFGTGGSGAGTGTGGGFGTGGIGIGTGGGMGTGGTSTGTGTAGSSGTGGISGMRDRLYFD
ncbi:cytochrome b5 domain-containing protein [Clostridium sp.]|uniref:cytochrome b5 domain-containing protein n=1 Tax=Clostridium sp. TaxID=1506 RepID=UPI00261B744D|nr:cytochrome b5 domain-containing protein [Clostridium sp.]